LCLADGSAFAGVRHVAEVAAEFIVQINGKKRGSIRVTAKEDTMLAVARADARPTEHLSSRPVRQLVAGCFGNP
jgi:hypothetical protein